MAGRQTLNRAPKNTERVPSTDWLPLPTNPKFAGAVVFALNEGKSTADRAGHKAPL